MHNFRSLTLSEWRQFRSIDIDLSKHITILTGQNGCGKTTILNVLGHHFGWNVHFVSTPYLAKRQAKTLWSDIFGFNSRSFNEDDTQTREVGTIIYDNNAICRLMVNPQVSAQYKPAYAGAQEVIGLHVPSHRPASTYHNVEEIPTNPATALQFYQNYQNLLNQLYASGNSKNPGRIQKQSLISLAAFGEGNNHMQSNPEFIKIFEGFQNVLRHILPPEIGFQSLQIRMPEVVLVTSSGDFALEAMSGGINSLFGMAWQIYMFGFDKDKCTVTIDEPENHLHPSMQRSFLPSLAKAFPNYRFIIASHSPFVVTSFPEANVYGLLHNEENRIVSRLLETSDLSGTPNKILRDVLDVRSNLPVWVEEKLSMILNSNQNLSDKEKPL
ncbi:MAG: AAA family ATPase [Micavibrio sp.]|nr:AAA family ATPase [Micavibrio sp.]